MGVGVKLQKWGNSTAVRIPKAVLEDANISPNDKVEISSNGHVIIITKQPTKIADTDSQEHWKLTLNNLRGIASGKKALLEDITIARLEERYANTH